MSGSWFLYIIEYQNSRLYTGITTDVERRFREHCSGGRKAARALRGKGPFRLVYTESVGNRSEALSREYQIKQMTRNQKLALIQT